MENHLNQIASYLLTQGWQIAILVIVIAAASWLLRNKSAHVRYLLWLIVLAKCLVPPLLTVPLPVLPDERVMIMLPPTQPMGVEPVEVSVVEVPVPAAPSAPVITKHEPRLTILQWLAIGWFMGASGFILVAVAKALRTELWLRRERKPLPAGLQSEIEELFSGLGVKISPKLWLVEGIGQPFVWGLLRGSIYLPGNFTKVDTPEHRRGILGHELSHILRFDAAVNLLQIAAQAVFWFHPFVWWANKRIRAEREKCCDEMAIARLGAKAKEYSSAIVNILITEHESTRPVPSLAVAGPVKNIEERIKTMLRPGKKFYRRPSLIAATTVLLAAFLTVPTALVLTARAQTEAPRPLLRGTPPLHEATLASDIEKVRSLLSKGANVNEKDAGGSRTALHYACERGHTEVAALLISRGADVNVSSWDAKTPLHAAAASGNKETVELLLSKRAHLEAKERYGRTPLFEAMRSPVAGRKEVVELLVAKGAKVPALHLAAYMGDIEKVKRYLDDGININSQEGAGCTALHAAASGGRKDIVEFLIGRGANVDLKDTSAMTPLYYAATHNREDIADLFLAKGADVNVKDERSFTLLYYAIWDESKDAIELLIAKGANVDAKDRAGYTPLVYAIWQNDKDIVELLLSKGADVNVEDNAGYTPYYWASMDASKAIVEVLTAKGAVPISTIHVATRAGDLAKVKRFIEEGTDVNARDKGGETPLFSAVLADNDDVAKFLLDKGADVNAQNNGGRTPLHFAIRARARTNMVELLISKGADVNAKTEAGQTPLHAACGSGQKAVAERLIAKGADVNGRTTGGVPRRALAPLHSACAYDHKDVAELLITNGADIDSRDSNGQTPLHIGCSRGHKDTVGLLIAKGADINAKDNKEQTALLLAKEQGRAEIVELLRKHGAKE